MIRPRGVPRTLLACASLAALVTVLILATAASAFAASTSNGLNWRNEGYSTATGWTTGEIGPYNEGDLVPFRLTVTNPGKASAVVGGFSLQVSAFNHGCAIFDYTTGWTGPLTASSQDGLVGDMLRTTFPAGLTLAPGASATFNFKGHLAVSTVAKPAAGMINGNGVVGFSKVDAAGVGAAGKDVPVKVNARQGTLGTPSVGVVESSDAPTTGVAPGTTVTYTFVVTNTGDVPLVNAVVTDSVFGTVGTIPGPIAPGASATLTVTAVATQTTSDSATVLANGVYGSAATASSNMTVAVLTTARIFGSDYADLNGNGAWDAGEPAVSDRYVALLDAGGNVIAETFTDATGAYAFDGLEPGVTYTVVGSAPMPWFISAPVGGTYTVTPTSGQDAGPYDFGAAMDGGV